MKTIYLAPNEEQGRDNLMRVTEKWSEKYPNAMKSWEQNWDVSDTNIQVFIRCSQG